MLSCIPDDPWGKPYANRPTADGFELSSAGPDGVRPTLDDIVWHRGRIEHPGNCASPSVHAGWWFVLMVLGLAIASAIVAGLLRCNRAA
ncbi:MAG: hypothetical protein AAF735_02925 [Myxococcota bacterium]